MENTNKTDKPLLKFVLKSGYEIVVSCEEYSINRNRDGSLCGYDLKGIKMFKETQWPCYINPNEVAAIIQFSGQVSDEPTPFTQKIEH